MGPLEVGFEHLLTINCFRSPATQPPRLLSPVPSRLRRRAMPPASASACTPSCLSVVPLPTLPTNISRPSSSSKARLRRTMSWGGASVAVGFWQEGAASFVTITHRSCFHWWFLPYISSCCFYSPVQVDRIQLWPCLPNDLILRVPRLSLPEASGRLFMCAGTLSRHFHTMHFRG